MDILRNIVLNMLDSIGGGLISSVSDIVSNGDKLINTGIYTTIFNACTDIGLSLLVLYFLIEMVEETTHDNFTIEHFIRLSIKFVVGKEIVDNLSTFIDASLAITNSLLQGLGADSSTSFATLESEIQDGGLLPVLGYMILLIFPWLLSIIIKAFVFIACYTRTFEIAIRGMFMPMAVPDIFSGGLNSSGFKYMKKFFAACLQGALMIAVVAMSAELSSATAISGDWPVMSIFNFLVIGATTAAVMMKTQQWASDIIG